MIVGVRVKLVGPNPYFFDEGGPDKNNHFYAPGNIGTIVETGGKYVDWYAIKIDGCKSTPYAFTAKEFEVVE